MPSSPAAPRFAPASAGASIRVPATELTLSDGITTVASVEVPDIAVSRTSCPLASDSAPASSRLITVRCAPVSITKR